MVFVSATCRKGHTQGLLERGVAVVTIRGVVLVGIRGDGHGVRRCASTCRETRGREGVRAAA
jgi:hypothetical protein